MHHPDKNDNKNADRFKAIDRAFKNLSGYFAENEEIGYLEYLAKPLFEKLNDEWRFLQNIEIFKNIITVSSDDETGKENSETSENGKQWDGEISESHENVHDNSEIAENGKHGSGAGDTEETENDFEELEVIHDFEESEYKTDDEMEEK
uniref:J domain-containing protein n=1 Tax=Panagrolaimus sp. ES5 TaxID=591445 RepID=A0AC34GJH2_9BILA